MNSKQAAARAAAEAHTNLNIYAAIVSILEGGHLYGANDDVGYAAQQRIIKTCHAEQARWLRRFDRAMKLVDRL